MVNLLNWSSMSEDERALAPFVQGVLNRKGIKVYVNIDNYMDYLDEEFAPVDLWELININMKEFDGAVCYDLDCNDVSINMAATISAAYDLLGVPRGLVDRVNKIGIKTVCDLADVHGNASERQRIVFDAVSHRLSHTALVHQVVREDNFHLVLRDFSICNRWACVYTDQTDEGRELRQHILSYLNKNIPVYGWTDDEISFVKDISTYGDYVIPMDWSSNHSYLGQCSCTVRQSTRRSEIREGKHYVALVVSDGDNIQWLERDFTTTSAFGQRQRSDSDYKMTWTLSPSLARLSPTVAKGIFDTRKMDYFITGVSGIGYANLLAYPMEHLDEFTRQTAEAMADSDLDVVCMLDDISLTQDAQNVEKRLSYYARFDGIEGGIWELDPDHYESGAGRVFEACGKPFISVRYSYWHHSGDPRMITREWMDAFADKVNALTASPDSADGYSVINIHPWSVPVAAVDYLVSRLNDHIELVYADELIELYKKNVIKKR